MGVFLLQQYIHTLEASLQEEMSRHAPLYGAGLEALSLKELETLSRIHEDGLRQIHALQQRKGSPAGSPLVSPHALPHTHGLYPTAAPPNGRGSASLNNPKWCRDPQQRPCEWWCSWTLV